EDHGRHEQQSRNNSSFHDGELVQRDNRTNCPRGCSRPSPSGRGKRCGPGTAVDTAGRCSPEVRTTSTSRIALLPVCALDCDHRCGRCMPRGEERRIRTRSTNGSGATLARREGIELQLTVFGRGFVVVDCCLYG